MIAANYTMHLYCENMDTHTYHEQNDIATAEYVAETWGQVAKMARLDGWRISRDRQRCYCPLCSGKPSNSDVILLQESEDKKNGRKP